MPLASHAVVEPGRAAPPSSPGCAWSPSPGAPGRPRPGCSRPPSMASCISCSWNSGMPRVFFSAGFQLRVRVGDRLQAVLAADVGVHRVALDRPGPDQRDLDDQVVELARLEPGQGGHLGPGLDLEHPDGVGGAQHVVDQRVFRRDLVQAVAVAVPFLDEVEAVLQRRQHAQAEQVELHQAGGGAVVLVPLQHGAVGHPAPLDRAHLDHRPVADHHAAGVDAQVPRGVLQLLGQLQHVLGDALDVGWPC